MILFACFVFYNICWKPLTEDMATYRCDECKEPLRNVCDCHESADNPELQYCTNKWCDEGALFVGAMSWCDARCQRPTCPKCYSSWTPCKSTWRQDMGGVRPRLQGRDGLRERPLRQERLARYSAEDGWDWPKVWVNSPCAHGKKKRNYNKKNDDFNRLFFFLLNIC